MTGWVPKRFWKEARAVAEGAGFAVRLDDRPVRTPAKALLVVPTAELAGAIAAEWNAQDKIITPEAMPMTRSANAAIDKVAPNIAGVVAEIAGYGATDHLCYRAEAPGDLVARQVDAWDPLVAWAAATHGARLTVTTGVMHVAQPSDSVQRLRQAVAGLGPFTLTALHDLVALSGSLIIGLRALHADADIDGLWQVSRIDEDWQAEKWGQDDEAAATTAEKRRAFNHAARFHRLVNFTAS